MLQPMLDLQIEAVNKVQRPNLVDSPVRYNLFKLGLGMMKVRRVDDVWFRNGIVDTP